MSNTLREKYAVPVLVGALVSVLALLLFARVAVDRSPQDAIVDYQPVLEFEEQINDYFVVVEQPPAIMGGLKGILERIKYPAIAQSAGIEGRVIVQFIVDEDGDVHDAEILRGIGGGCDEEALRVVSETKFVPGMQSGQNVKVKMSLPVQFRLS